MYTFLFNDQVIYDKDEPLLYPIFIVGADKSLIRVLIGKPMDNNKVDYKIAEDFGFGIYVETKDYVKINHNNPYILFHDTDALEEDKDEIVIWIDQMWSLEKNDDCHHIHVKKTKENTNFFTAQECYSN